MKDLILSGGNRFTRFVVALLARVLGLKLVVPPRRADELYTSLLDRRIDNLATAAQLMIQSPDASALTFLRDAVNDYRKAEQDVIIRGGR